MRARELVREAWRNTVFGTSRATLWALALAALCGSLAWLDVGAARGIVDDAYRFQRAGASTLVLEAPGLVDGAACEALASLPNVRAAGALRAGARHKLPALPQQPASGSDITPGFAAVLGAETAVDGVLLPTELAERLRATAGGTAAIGDGDVRVAAVYDYPDDGRRPGFGYLVLSPVPVQGRFDQCWADAWPAFPELRRLLMSTVDGQPSAQDQQPTVSQLNTTLGTEFDGPARFATRATAWTPLAALVGGAALGFAAVRLRRLELAAALHCGVPREAQLAQSLLEASVWICLSWLLAIPVLVVRVLGLDRADAWPLATMGALSLLAGCIGALAGVLGGVLVTRETSLFAYFKLR